MIGKVLTKGQAVRKPATNIDKGSCLQIHLLHLMTQTFTCTRPPPPKNILVSKPHLRPASSTESKNVRHCGDSVDMHFKTENFVPSLEIY